MKNKTLIITNIILLCSIIAGLLIFMVLGLRGKIVFFGNKATLIDTIKYQDVNLNEVLVNVKSYDIEIIESTNNQVEVEIYGNKKTKDNTSVEINNGTLNITQKRNTLCFGFCYNSNIVIKLPKSYIGKFDIHTISGDIDSNINLKSDDNNVISTSGDIKLLEVINGSIKSTSGEIEIAYLKNGKVKTTSGDIQIGTLEIGDISSTSGEMEIDKFNGYGDISTTSGDIRLNSFSIQNRTSINSVSGDVRVKLLNEADVDASTTSGDKNIKNTQGDYELSIKTISGDITVK